MDLRLPRRRQPRRRSRRAARAGLARRGDVDLARNNRRRRPRPPRRQSLGRPRRPIDDRWRGPNAAQRNNTAGRGGPSTRSFVTFSADGKTWTPREFVTEPGRWMWSITWHEGAAWGVAYGAPARAGVSSLLTSRDGQKFDVAVDEFFAQAPRPTEARLRFAADGTALCLHRCDGPAEKQHDKGVPANTAWLGRAAAPYRDWNWRPLDRFIGGPNLIELPTGQWLAAGRILQPQPVTALMHLDPEQSRATPILTLPSGGDTSYPGLVWHDGRLWMSYYSSHEKGTNIYLAEVRIHDAEE